MRSGPLHGDSGLLATHAGIFLYLQRSESTAMNLCISLSIHLSLSIYLEYAHTLLAESHDEKFALSAVHCSASTT